MKIYVQNKQKDLSVKAAKVKLLVHSFLEFHNIRYSEIAIHLVSDKKMRLLHQQFFDDPSPTDCMTFPIDSYEIEGAALGDIFVCPKIAILYADRMNKDPYKELSLYIIHGLLHLLEYNDIEKEDRKRMKRKEKEEMARLSKMKLLL